MEFNVSNETVTQKIIGNIVYENQAVDVKELLVNGKMKIIHLDHDVFDILPLNRNRFVCSSRLKKCLIMYDKNFYRIKTVDKINEVSFLPVGIASYDNHLYIADQLSHCIIKLDFEFNKIKSIGSFGSGFIQFNSPLGICCKDGILYICDNRNQRIQIYNKDLEFIDSVKVDYEPWVIKITNSCLFVEAGNKPGLFIYELNSLSLKQKIENSPSVICRLSVINSSVYRYNSESKVVLFYDANGNLKEQIIRDNLVRNLIETKYVLDGTDGTFIAFNGYLLMTSFSGKLIKFSK